jgi:heme/copper-type cytochrome/quinol oxidase subunit 2
MNHSDMPISVHAVSPADYKTWLDQQKAKNSNASLDAPAHMILASEH